MSEDDSNELTKSEQLALLNGRALKDVSTVDGISEKVYRSSKDTWALCDLLGVRLADSSAAAFFGTPPLPEWALQALYEKLIDVMLSELPIADGRGQTAVKSTELMFNRRHAARYLQVVVLRDMGFTYEEAYERVAEISADNPLEKREISARAVKASDLKVRNDIKQGGTKFYIPVTNSVRMALLAHLKLT